MQTIIFPDWSRFDSGLAWLVFGSARFSFAQLGSASPCDSMLCPSIGIFDSTPAGDSIFPLSSACLWQSSICLPRVFRVSAVPPEEKMNCAALLLCFAMLLCCCAIVLLCFALLLLCCALLCCAVLSCAVFCVLVLCSVFCAVLLCCSTAVLFC